MNRPFPLRLNRLIRLIFELFGLLLILTTVGLGALVWRLQQGPLPLVEFVPEIESGLNSISPGLSFKLSNVQLEEDERFHAIRLHLTGVRVQNARGHDVGMLKDMILGYNWRNIVGFSLMPVSLEIIRPTVEITRFENDTVGFNLKEVDDKEEDEVSQMTPVEAVTASLDRAPRVLRHIRISDARIRYFNRKRQYRLDGENGLFVFTRARGDIRGTMAFDVTSHIFQHRVTGDIAHDESSRDTTVSIAVKDVLLNDLRLLTPEIPEAINLDMPMSMLVSASVDGDLKWRNADVTLMGTSGRLVFPPYVPEALDLSDFLLKSSYDPEKNSVTLESLVMKLGDSSVVASGKMDINDTGLTIAAKAETRQVPVDKLPVYWPHGLGTNARDWVTQHISEGIATSAQIETELFVPTVEKEDGKTDEPEVKKLGGTIRFENVSVDYLPPMPKVVGVNGEATFDADKFYIKANSGRLFDTLVKSGDVTISELLTDDPAIAIDLQVEGPIKDAISTISYEPLKYAQSMGMTPEQFTGDSELALHLSFPLLVDLKLEQVEMKAVSQLKKATIRNILKDLTVTSELLNLEVDTEKMHVTGDARVNGSLATIEWHEFFSSDAENTTVIKAKGKATPAIIRGLRIPIHQYFSGSADAEIMMTQDHEKTVHVDVDANLAGFGIDVREWGIIKPSSLGGKASFKLSSDAKGIITISHGNVSWPRTFVSDAMMRLDAAQNLESLTMKNLRHGRTTGDLIIAPDGKGGSRVVLRGDVVDLTGPWAHQSENKDKKQDARKIPLSLSVRAATLYLDEEIPFTGVKLEANLRGDELVTANVYAETENDAHVSVVQIAQKDGSRTLSVQSNDTGRILRALDMVDDVYGGILDIKGSSLPTTPSQITGTFTLSDFTLVKAPIMARLLNAFSPVGLLNLLNGKGLSFTKMHSEFTLPDPHTIRLDKGKMAGASLGLSFSGNVYRDTGKLDIRGTLVPLDGINKFIGKIPLIGQILGGINKDGLIGATYRVRGDSADPSVSVNPLSALTPGIFRSILFE